MKISENRSKLAALAAATLVASAFALIVGAFTTQQAVAQTLSSHPLAVGGFAPADTDMDGITHVAFAAQQNPQLAGYAGYVVQETSTGVRSGPVTCLSVTVTSATSNTGVVVWTVKQSNIAGDTIGATRSFEAMDNGDPVMGVLSPDMYKDRGNDTTCIPDDKGTNEALVSGNIVVSR